MQEFTLRKMNKKIYTIKDNNVKLKIAFTNNNQFFSQVI